MDINDKIKSAAATLRSDKAITVYALKARLNTYKNGTVFHHPDCKR